MRQLFAVRSWLFETDSGCLCWLCYALHLIIDVTTDLMIKVATNHSKHRGDHTTVTYCIWLERKRSQSNEKQQPTKIVKKKKQFKIIFLVSPSHSFWVYLLSFRSNNINKTFTKWILATNRHWKLLKIINHRIWWFSCWKGLDSHLKAYHDDEEKRLRSLTD
jgi:hypothetical protein